MKLVEHLEELTKANGWVDSADITYLDEYFLDKFGVRVKKFQNKYVFKYDMIFAKCTEERTSECRGTILYFRDGIWSVHSRPFNKFFNLSEGHCKYFDNDFCNKNIEHVRLVEKKDGTCIQVAYDYECGMFRASTLGSIETTNFSDDPKTFSELFWETIQKIGRAHV